MPLSIAYLAVVRILRLMRLSRADISGLAVEVVVLVGAENVIRASTWTFDCTIPLTKMERG
jgi:hypothetical protein